MVRLIAFSCVILAHVVNGVNDMADPDVAAVSMSMHFTRNAFFFLTAVVLVYGYRDRDPGVFSFWRKRIGIVAVPYAIWSAIYTVIDDPHATLGGFASAFEFNLVTGGSMYNMYFLVVSIQFYVVFPLFLAVLKAMRRLPVLTLTIAALVQWGLNSFEAQDPAPNAGFLPGLWPYLTSLLPSYLFYFVLGGVVGLHLEAVTEWMRTHLWHMLGFAALGLAVVQFWYFGLIGAGVHPFTASNALQPTLMVWCVPAVLAVYAIGVRWSDRRYSGSVSDKILAGGTERSFGIYLGHPLVLAVLYQHFLGRALSTFGHVGATLVIYLAGVAGTLLMVEVLRRTRWSKRLIGRPGVAASSQSTKDALRALLRPASSS